VLAAALGAEPSGAQAARHPADPPAPPAPPVPTATAPVPTAFPAQTVSIPTLSGTRPIDVFLTRMLEAGASDLHLSSGAAPTLRVHGEITPQTDLPVLTSADIERLLDPILPQENRNEF